MSIYIFCLYASFDCQPPFWPAWDNFYFIFLFIICIYCCKIHICISSSDIKSQSLAPRLFVYLHPDNWSIFSRNLWEKNQTEIFDLVTLQSVLLTRFHHTGGIMLHNRQSLFMHFFIKILGVLLQLVVSFAKSRGFFCVCFCNKTKSMIVHWG